MMGSIAIVMCLAIPLVSLFATAKVPRRFVKYEIDPGSRFTAAPFFVSVGVTLPREARLMAGRAAGPAIKLIEERELLRLPNQQENTLHATSMMSSESNTLEGIEPSPAHIAAVAPTRDTLLCSTEVVGDVFAPQTRERQVVSFPLKETSFFGINTTVRFCTEPSENCLGNLPRDEREMSSAFNGPMSSFGSF